MALLTSVIVHFSQTKHLSFNALYPVLKQAVGKYIATEESRANADDAGLAACYVRFAVSEAMWEKLRQLAKYCHLSVSELVQKPCTAALAAFMEMAARQVSLERNGMYQDGDWPFAPQPREALKRKNKFSRSSRVRGCSAATRKKFSEANQRRQAHDKAIGRQALESLLA